jgi:hypothetical protein
MLRRYRALGADPPFADLRRGHGVTMEGHFWRFSDARSGRVVLALCGVCRDREGSWGNVALAGHPGGFMRAADLPCARADPLALGVRARGAAGSFAADEHGLELDLGPDARLTVALQRAWPDRPAMLGGSGAAHLIPGLGQYWHPHLLGARVAGTAVLGSETVDLGGFQAYAEKNWSPRGGFPLRWWWGQAQGFDDPELCVAFAGGEVTVGPARLDASGLVLGRGGRVVRLGNPLLAPITVSADGERWAVRARGPRWSVELEGGAPPGAAHVLPIPVPAERRSVPGAHEHLAARLHVILRRRGRVAYAGESAVAGLEVGPPPAC